MIVVELTSRLTLRMGLANVIALPVAVTYSESEPGDQFPGTELGIIIGPFIISFAWE